TSPTSPQSQQQQEQSPTTTQTASPFTSSTNSSGSQLPASRTPTVAVLYPKVGPIYTRRQVSAQVASQIATYFRARNYDLAPAPTGVQSVEQYVSISRNSGGTRADWAVEAGVDMEPTLPRTNNSKPYNQMAPNNPNPLVDLTMNCSVTITLVHIPI